MRITGLFILCLLLFGCSGGGGGAEAEPTPTAPPMITEPDEPAPPVLLTWALHGVLVDGGTVDGTITHAKDTGVTGTNVRGLTPNVTYTLTDWDVQVRQTFLPLAPVIFSSDGGEAEVCIGKCIFSPVLMQRILLTSGSSTLALIFMLPEGFGTAIPQSIGEWGPFDPTLSEFRMVRETEYVWPVTAGVISNLDQ